MTRKLLIFSINRLQSILCNETLNIHKEKLDTLIVNKCVTEGTQPNPNKIITNLTNCELTENEVEVLRLGLKHGLILQPKETEMFAVIEDLWDQIEQQKVLKGNSFFSKHTAQTVLKAFTYNYLEVDNKQIKMDKKRIQLLKEMPEKFMILKADKGQGVVSLTKEEYVNSIQHIFSDKRKFKIVKDDPTINNLTTVQKYIDTLAKRGEITDSIKTQIRPKSAQLGKAYGLPKIHKHYTTIPPLRPIVGNAGTAHYGIVKYLVNFLNPLTLNEYSHLKQ